MTLKNPKQTEVTSTEIVTLPDLTPGPMGAGLRWRLPRRPWGAGRWVPVTLLMVGAGLLAFAVQRVLWGAGVNFWAIVGGAAGSGALVLGAVLRFSYGVIELNGGVVRVGDRLLGFGWMRTYPAETIGRLEVECGTVRCNSGAAQPMENFALLMGPDGNGSVPKDGRPVGPILAWGYPRAWLRVVADELAQVLSVDGPGGGRRAEPVRVIETMASSDADAGAAEEVVPDPPADTEVMVERGGDHLNFIVDGGRDHGLSGFACIWNGVGALFVLILGYQVVAGGFTTRDFLVFLGVLVIAGGVGAFLFAWTYRMRHTQTLLDIAGHGTASSLTLRIVAPFTGERVHRWMADELASVRVDRSGMEVNDRPVMQLVLCPREGKRVGALAGLTDPELLWIAAEVRRQMGLPGYLGTGRDRFAR